MTIRIRDVDPPQAPRPRPTSPYLDNRQLAALDARLEGAVNRGDATDFVAAMREILHDPRHISFRKFSGCPLHWVAAVGRPALLADYLSLNGFKEVSVRNAAGLTPLHVVAAICLPEAPAMAAMLLAAGAPVNARDKEGMTPLHLAIGFPSASINRQGDGDVVALVATLMGEGADPSIKSVAGERASDRWNFAAAPSPEKGPSMPTTSLAEEAYADPVPVPPAAAPSGSPSFPQAAFVAPSGGSDATAVPARRPRVR